MPAGSDQAPDLATPRPSRGPANTEALTPVAGAQPYDPNGRGSRGVDAAGNGEDSTEDLCPTGGVGLPAHLTNTHRPGPDRPPSRKATTMPIHATTNEVMRQLPTHLRPKPLNIDDPLEQLADKGWSPRDIVQATLADNPKQPGHVVSFLRTLIHQPAPASPTHTYDLGPCQQDCDHGWINDTTTTTTPCPTCRPNTHRRLTQRETARARGASHTTLAGIMTNDHRKLEPVPHTTPHNGL